MSAATTVNCWKCGQPMDLEVTPLCDGHANDVVGVAPRDARSCACPSCGACICHKLTKWAEEGNLIEIVHPKFQYAHRDVAEALDAVEDRAEEAEATA